MYAHTLHTVYKGNRERLKVYTFILTLQVCTLPTHPRMQTHAYTALSTIIGSPGEDE